MAHHCGRCVCLHFGSVSLLYHLIHSMYTAGQKFGKLRVFNLARRLKRRSSSFLKNVFSFGKRPCLQIKPHENVSVNVFSEYYSLLANSPLTNGRRRSPGVTCLLRVRPTKRRRALRPVPCSPIIIQFDGKCSH